MTVWNSTFKNHGAGLRRTGFTLKAKKPLNQRTATLKRSGKPMRARRSTHAPTIAERAWMDFLVEFGCVVCWLQHQTKTPCAVHHLVEGGRRLGHMMTIGLCDPGHHQGATADSGKISRHPNKARFEAAYGTEYELLEFLQEQYKC